MKTPSQSYFHIRIKDRIAHMRMDHPPLNALNVAMASELERHLDDLEKDVNVKVIILSSARAGIFSDGLDLNEAGKIKNLDEYSKVIHFTQSVFDKVEQLEKPVIAAIHGRCAGAGLELAMACHIRVAAHSARFSLPELKLGFTPGFGGTERLSKLIGASAAREMILTGTFWSAKRALQMRLVNHKVFDFWLMRKAFSLARHMTQFSLPAIRSLMRAVNQNSSLSILQVIEAGEAEFAHDIRTRDSYGRLNGPFASSSHSPL